MESIKKILRLENMLTICLFFEISELKYAYQLYVYKERVVVCHFFMDRYNIGFLLNKKKDIRVYKIPIDY